MHGVVRHKNGTMPDFANVCIFDKITRIVESRKRMSGRIDMPWMAFEKMYLVSISKSLLWWPLESDVLRPFDRFSSCIHRVRTVDPGQRDSSEPRRDESA